MCSTFTSLAVWLSTSRSTTASVLGRYLLAISTCAPVTPSTAVRSWNGSATCPALPTTQIYSIALSTPTLICPCSRLCFATVGITVATLIAVSALDSAHTPLSWTPGCSLPCPAALRSTGPALGSTLRSCFTVHSCDVRCSSSPSTIFHTADTFAWFLDFSSACSPATHGFYGSRFRVPIAHFETLLPFILFLCQSSIFSGIPLSSSNPTVLSLLISLPPGTESSTSLLIVAVNCFYDVQSRTFASMWCPSRSDCSLAIRSHGKLFRKFCSVFKLIRGISTAHFRSWNTFPSVTGSALRSFGRWTVDARLLLVSPSALQFSSKVARFRLFGTQWRTEEFTRGLFYGSWAGSGCVT